MKFLTKLLFLFAIAALSTSLNLRGPPKNDQAPLAPGEPNKPPKNEPEPEQPAEPEEPAEPEQPEQPAEPEPEQPEEPEAFPGSGTLLLQPAIGTPSDSTLDFDDFQESVHTIGSIQTIRIYHDGLTIFGLETDYILTCGALTTKSHLGTQIDSANLISEYTLLEGELISSMLIFPSEEGWLAGIQIFNQDNELVLAAGAEIESVDMESVMLLFDVCRLVGFSGGIGERIEILGAVYECDGMLYESEMIDFVQEGVMAFNDFADLTSLVTSVSVYASDLSVYGIDVVYSHLDCGDVSVSHLSQEIILEEGESDVVIYTYNLGSPEFIIDIDAVVDLWFQKLMLYNDLGELVMDVGEATTGIEIPVVESMRVIAFKGGVGNHLDSLQVYSILLRNA